MARKNFNKQIVKIVAGVVLLIVALIGLEYGSLLSEMKDAAQDYSRGNAGGALKKYEDVRAAAKRLRRDPVDSRRGSPNPVPG